MATYSWCARCFHCRSQLSLTVSIEAESILKSRSATMQWQTDKHIATGTLAELNKAPCGRVTCPCARNTDRGTPCVPRWLSFQVSMFVRAGHCCRAQSLLHRSTASLHRHRRPPRLPRPQRIVAAAYGRQNHCRQAKRWRTSAVQGHARWPSLLAPGHGHASAASGSTRTLKTRMLTHDDDVDLDLRNSCHCGADVEEVSGRSRHLGVMASSGGTFASQQPPVSAQQQRLQPAAARVSRSPPPTPPTAALLPPLPAGNAPTALLSTL